MTNPVTYQQWLRRQGEQLDPHDAYRAGRDAGFKQGRSEGYLAGVEDGYELARATAEGEPLTGPGKTLLAHLARELWAPIDETRALKANEQTQETT